MNKKRKIDDVLESIFNLIQDAHNELEDSEKGNEIKNNLAIELDVQMLEDKNLAVFHDDELSRLVLGQRTNGCL